MVPKGPGANPSLAALAGNDNVTFKPLVKHIVSKELILYFHKIRNAILDTDPDPEAAILRESAFASVRSDPGLHQLVPYFVQFISEKVTHNLNDTFVLRQMMELTAAMITNPSLHIDPYVTSIVPAVLTCLIGRSVGPEGPNMKDQYDLRDFSSSLITKIGFKYAETTTELRPRLGRTLLNNFCEYDKSLGTHYGCVKALAESGGPEVVRNLIIGLPLANFDPVIDRAIKQRGEDDIQVKMLIDCIMKAIRSVVAEENVITNGANGNMEDASELIIQFLGPHIGRRVIALGDHKLNKIILEIKAAEENKKSRARE